MKSVRIIFITLEVLALYGVIFLAFKDFGPDMHTYKAIYISLFAILAVVFQKEQQAIQEMLDEEDEMNETIERWIDIESDK